jgi:ABC-type phosphate transport system substrate-binding protein
MKNRLMILAFALAALATSGLIAAEQSVVIVNPSNPTDSMRKADVSRLFLKQTSVWSNGSRVLPVDLASTSPTRADFTRAVHGRSLEAILAYWNQKMFSGAEVPPPQKVSDKDVIEFVRANPGAVGYVSSSAPVQQVKILRIVD